MSKGRIRKDINYKFHNLLEEVMKKVSIPLRHEMFRAGFIQNKAVDDEFERFVRRLAWNTYYEIEERAKRERSGR